MKYPLVYADPPWRYDDASTHRGGAERHYRTLPMATIGHHIEQHASRHCLLACWQTWPMLEEQDALLRACGWTRRTLGFVWIKTTDDGHDLSWGMGHFTRSNSEPLFFWTRGSSWPRRVHADVHQVIFAPRAEHSRKPDEARTRLERLFGPVRRIELYARQHAPGWDAWGDQLDQQETE